jgi:hypothetical protein
MAHSDPGIEHGHGMDSSKIFRKAAIDRMSSPEEIDALLVVTTPKSWLALSALVILLILASIWGLCARLTTRVSGEGVLIQSGKAGSAVRQSLPESDAGTLMAVIYIPFDIAVAVRPGMDAEISLASTRREEHGFLRGKVIFASDTPATETSIRDRLRNDALVQALKSRGLISEIRVELQADPSSRSGYRWSTLPGPALRLHPGILCKGDVIVRSQRPVSLIFSDAHAAAENR